MKATNHTITTLVTLVLMLLLGQGALTSCRDKQHIKSLSEMLRDEKKMIDNFIEEQGMRVMLRMIGRFIAPDYKHTFDNLSKGYQQSTEFIYINSRDRTGSVHYKLIQEQYGHSIDALMCEGVAYPLTMVGNGARIRLLVPFLLGPNVAYNAGAPRYCEEVWYQFVEES